MSEEGTSPIAVAFARLRERRPNWDVVLGVPSGPFWIEGAAFRDAGAGPFADLLGRIAVRLRCEDRKVVAASFALRFGWAAGTAFAPYLLHQCVPDMTLENLFLRFGESTLFEKVALRKARGWLLPVVATAPHPLITFARNDAELVQGLRAMLLAQAEPVVSALHQWSNLPMNVLWGQVASSWGGQFCAIFAELGRHADALAHANAFFDAPGLPFSMRPHLYAIEHCGVTRVYQRRAACCLYYKLPEARFCASCPLLPEEDRLARNRVWLERSLGAS